MGRGRALILNPGSSLSATGSFNPLGGGAGSGSQPVCCLGVRVPPFQSPRRWGGVGLRGRCNDWPDMSLGSGFPYPPENSRKLGSLSLAPGPPGQRKRRGKNRLGQVVTGTRNRVNQGYEIRQSKKRRARPPRSGTEHDKEPGGNRRPARSRSSPSNRNGAKQAVSACLDDEHDLVAGTGLELSQAQEDRLLLAGRGGVMITRSWDG